MPGKEGPLVALGIAGAALALAYYLSSKQPQSPKLLDRLCQEDDVEAINQERSQLERSRELLTNLSNNLNIEKKKQGILTKKSLLDFIMYAIQSVSEKQVEQLYMSSRRARRVFFSPVIKEMSAANYFKYVCFFDNEIQFIISKSHKDLAAFANIDEDMIENSIDYHLDNDPRFTNQLISVTVQLRRAIKNKLTPLRGTDLEIVQKIKQRSTQIVNDEAQDLCDAISSLQMNPEDGCFIPSFIHMYISDRIHYEFGFEEEDIMSLELELLDSAEGRQLLQKFQTAQSNLMRRLEPLQDL